MDKGRKMEGDYRRQKWPTWSLRKEGVTPSDIHRRLSAVCGQKAPAHSTVFNWVQNFSSGNATAQAALSMSGTVTSLNDGSVKPPRTSQGHDSHV